MKANILFNAVNQLNGLGLSMTARNKVIDLLSLVEAKAKVEVLTNMIADLEVKKETWEEYTEELMGEGEETCPECKLGNMRSIYDNVGFTEPDGPSKLEVIGLQCTSCGHKE